MFCLGHLSVPYSCQGNLDRLVIVFAAAGPPEVLRSKTALGLCRPSGRCAMHQSAPIPLRARGSARTASLNSPLPWSPDLVAPVDPVSSQGAWSVTARGTGGSAVSVTC